MDYLIRSYQKQTSGGLTPEQVKFTTSLPQLRDATVEAIVDMYDFMTEFSGRELVKKVINFSCCC